LQAFDIKNYKIDTLFFGGGTPSLMPVKYAKKIIKKLRLADDAEFTIEANPKTIAPLELKAWKDLGLNRLSIGIQSFNDNELEFLGRIHTVRDSMELLDAANDIGLRVSGDFIYGLPSQKVSDIVKLCERINSLGLPHASLYELTIEKGTKFQNMPRISESLAAGMYQAIQSSLKLPRYEVSNYGDPCRHNANVWAGEEYIGVGKSAAGRIIRRFEWIATKVTSDCSMEMTELSTRERSVEIVMTGLRTTRGVCIKNSPTPTVINWDFIKKNPKYFSYDDSFLRVNDSGLLLLDWLTLQAIKTFPEKRRNYGAACALGPSFA
jgi:oxygen-independent coproporphyrinogen-3 oxidase